MHTSPLYWPPGPRSLLPFRGLWEHSIFCLRLFLFLCAGMILLPKVTAGLAQQIFFKDLLCQTLFEAQGTLWRTRKVLTELTQTMGLSRERKTSVCVLSHFSCVRLCDPMGCSPAGSSSMGFSRQEYWSGLPCPPPGIFLTQGSNPHLLHWQVDSLPLSHQWMCGFNLHFSDG